MIDFDRFWAEPGCLPGMNKEESEAYLRQEMGGKSFEEFASDQRLDPKPGVTAIEIQSWEQEHGVRLPEVLRQALTRQNGGYVFDSAFRVWPLEEMVPNDEEFWEYATYEEEEVPDRELVFQFGEDEFGGACHLNYARGPQKEPSVFVYHSDPGDLDKCADSVTKFFARMLKTAEAPSVDWSETEALEVIAGETIDLSRLHPQGGAKEQILGRQNGVLVLFTRERVPRLERITKTTLPEPLFEHAAMIMPFRPDPINTSSLTLQPEEPEGIVERESERRRDGQWKNKKSRGVPVCVQFESHDRTRLEALRQTLFGDKAAKAAHSREELQRKTEALAPEEMQAAGMSLFQQIQQMKQRMFPGGPPKVPAEAAALQELLQVRMAEIEQRIKERTGDQPPHPEIERLLGRMMDRPAKDDESDDD